MEAASAAFRMVLSFIFEMYFMKKAVLMGLSACLMASAACATQPSATELLGTFEGRYAQDCSRAKAMQVSYIIGEQGLHRYAQGKGQRLALETVWVKDDVSPMENSQYAHSRQYGPYQIDFYQSETQLWAKLTEKSGLMKWKESSIVLPQCQSD